MAQAALHEGARTLTTSILAAAQTSSSQSTNVAAADTRWQVRGHVSIEPTLTAWDMGPTGKGILIGMLSAFGTAFLVALVVAFFYILRYTNPGRILLDRFTRPGEFDDEQQFLREEEEALAEMDDLQRAEYLRAKAFVQANPPESVQTDISLSQFLAIQEKGVSAWEFEPELEIANCFVEARTEIEFFDSECSVQSNLPIPKQNDVYYWEAKIYDKPDTTTISIGLTTKPYPLFRLPGFHKCSVAYLSSGYRRFNQPFAPTPFAPAYVQGDVIGVGYRPRTGSVFFTRNGKKLDEFAHGLKTQNFFPTVGANGPCAVHVNFGQMGYVMIEANVRKWSLAPMTGSLPPPPPYGSEAGSVLLEAGHSRPSDGHLRSHSNQLRLAGRPMRSPNGPGRSPTEISLAQLTFDYTTHSSTTNAAERQSDDDDDDAGEGRASSPPVHHPRYHHQNRPIPVHPGLPFEPADHPPPEYESPEGSQASDDDDDDGEEDEEEDEDSDTTPRAGGGRERRPLLSVQQQQRGTTQTQSRNRNRNQDQNQGRGGAARETGRERERERPDPPIPSYEAATGRRRRS